MKRGDGFRIDIDHPPPFFLIFPEEGVDVPKQRVLEGHVFEDTATATAVVFSRRLELTDGQTSRMNACVLTRYWFGSCFCPQVNNHRFGAQWIGNVYAATYSNFGFLLHFASVMSFLFRFSECLFSFVGSICYCSVSPRSLSQFSTFLRREMQFS